jgi:hypothetical protein
LTTLVWDTVLPWRNPPFIRFWRSRLRARKAIFWCLLTLIVTTFVAALMYTLRTNASTPPQDAAREIWIPLLIIQGVLLMIKGTGSVSAGLIQDKIDQTLDYQRLTPATPLRNLLGYLFGLPVLEYVLFALTLPHLAFVAIVGNLPPATMASVYFSFFVCVVMYHMTAIAAGMVMRRWLLGYMLSILLVLFVNVILPSLVSQLGLRFFQYLSVWPVIGQKVIPLVAQAPQAEAAAANPFLGMAAAVPFFNLTLSPFLFTLLLQGALIATFGVMALRRWKSATKHSLSKPFALVFLVGFIVVLLGNVWPIVTRQYMPFALFGRQSIDELGDVVAVGLPLVYSFVVWLLCLVLLAIVVPSHDSFVRGVRRAVKLGRVKARPWDDDAAALGVYALFTGVAVAGLGIMLREIHAAGFLRPFGAPMHGAWRLPLALGLAVFYTALVIQALELRRTVLVILLVWWLPILVAIVLSARSSGIDAAHAVIAAISPLSFVFMTGMLSVETIAPRSLESELSANVAGANAGLVFIAVQIGALWLHWRRRRAAATR